MQRRRFLEAVGGSAAAGVAGCLSLTPGSDEHPFAGTTQRVAIEDVSTSDHDLEQNTEESLAFWEENSESFAGFDVSFRLVESSPDLVIRYADSPEGCEDVEGFDSTRVLGCAPVLVPGRRVPDPVVARVVAGDRPFGLV